MSVPPTNERAPALERRGFVCPHCNVLSQQTWEDICYSALDEDGSRWPHVLEPYPGPPRGPGVPVRWRGACCGTCDQWSLWRDGKMVYPVQARLGNAAHDDMPPHVRDLYEEAAAVAVVSPRAGAAFARVTVERLIKHLDPEAPTHANLDQRIVRIKGQGISTALGQMLDMVRVAGNSAVHVDDQPNDLMMLVLDDKQSPELVRLLLQATNDLVDELITKPRVTGELWRKIPEGIRARQQQ
jgi:hypothetical protein